jgi:tetratricopeptide (TPR) repeat protein
MARRFDPYLLDARVNLGGILCDEKHDYDGAIAEFHAALRLKPDLGKANFTLGVGLRQKAQFREALASLQRAQQPGYKHPDPESSARLLRETEGMVMLERKLPAILAGQAKPADAAETLGFAQLCYEKKLHTASARLFGPRSRRYRRRHRAAHRIEVGGFAPGFQGLEAPGY